MFTTPTGLLGLACPVDGPGGAYKVPVTAAQWNALQLPIPSHGYGCQDLSGNMLDSIGGMALVAAGAGIGYQTPITGWSGKSISIGGVINFSVGAGTGPNVATQSVAWLAYAADVTSANKDIMLASSASSHSVRGRTTAALPIKTSLLCNGLTANGSVSIPSGMSVYLLTLNRTAGAVAFYSNLEKVIGTYNAGVLDGFKGIGAAGGGNSATGKFRLVAAFEGAAAEAVANSPKTFLQTLGWSIPWS